MTVGICFTSSDQEDFVGQSRDVTCWIERHTVLSVVQTVSGIWDGK